MDIVRPEACSDPEVKGQIRCSLFWVKGTGLHVSVTALYVF